MLLEPEAKHLDWYTDPSDLERALAKRRTELEPRPVPAHETPAELNIAKELGRITQH